MLGRLTSYWRTLRRHNPIEDYASAQITGNQLVISLASMFEGDANRRFS